MKHVMLNTGLETLGTLNNMYNGVFEQSGIVNIQLPSTLKVLGNRTFKDCNKLKNIQLPEGLLNIGDECFHRTALTAITLPVTLQDVE